MNAVAAYFDLSREPTRTRNVSDKAPVIPQYVALALGVIAEPFVHEYIKSHTVTLSLLGPQVIFGLIIAIIIFPGVYRNAFDQEKPIMVQLCAIFASGVGWQSLFQAATDKNGGGTATGDAANGVANNGAVLLGMFF